MVFHKKLPGQPPRPRRSAQSLASELDVQVSVVLDALKAVGEFVDSPRKRVIEEPVIKKVYAHLGRTYIPEPVKDLSAWQFRDSGGRSGAATPAKVRLPSRSDAPRSFASRDHSVGLGDKRSDTADAWAYEEWKIYGFSPVERDAWIDGGLRRGQAKTARD